MIGRVWWPMRANSSAGKSWLLATPITMTTVRLVSSITNGTITRSTTNRLPERRLVSFARRSQNCFWVILDCQSWICHQRLACPTGRRWPWRGRGAARVTRWIESSWAATPPGWKESANTCVNNRPLTLMINPITDKAFDTLIPSISIITSLLVDQRHWHSRTKHRRRRITNN